MDFQTALLCLFLVAAGVTLLSARKRRHGLPLPPGPHPLPLIGNALDVPTKNASAAFRDLSTKYGDVMYFNVLGQPMVILGSYEAAIDLLEKRSANYSDRPPSTIAYVAGFDWALTLQSYGPWWRRHRKAFHQFFNPNAVVQYAADQKLEAHRLVLRLIRKPENFLHHIRHLFGSAIMRVAYGIEVDEEPVDYLKLAEETMDVFAKEFEPGRHLVETIPFLRFLPSWMPGARFKREGPRWREITSRLVEIPWKFTLGAVKAGTARPSMAAGLISQIGTHDVDVEDEQIVARNATAAAYAGGADTTLATVQSLFLALVIHPEVQKKAQDELDAVVGPNRLPEFDDIQSLPYIRALIKECLRWHPVVPLAVAHRSLEDDEYRGYFIPKGSIIIPNIWSVSRDPEVYPDPERFMPERFLKDGQLDPNVRDPGTFVFGYGRRVCPGRHFAESSLFIIASTVLHTLSISPPIDENGKPIQLEAKRTHGLLSYPEPFKCVIKPRRPDVEALVRTSCAELEGSRE